jgi:predicted solute-binding protein
MNHPVAMIPYTNMAPFQALGPPDGCRFVPLVPRESIVALCHKRVIAAAVPVGGLAAVAESTDFLGQFGIAAAKRSMSVLFFSDRPLSEMGARTRIRLTTESASSIRLLFLVLGYRNGFDNLPQLAKPNECPNGELLIGDAALIRMRDRRSGSLAADGVLCSGAHVTDLASEWHAVHHLPFVFARWVVSKDAPSSVRNALETWLSKFKIREQALVKQSVPEAARRIGASESEITTYFKLIRRTLDASDLAGQAKFLSEYDRHFGDDAVCSYWAAPDSEIWPVTKKQAFG